VLINAGLIGTGAISLQPPGTRAVSLAVDTGNVVVHPRVFRIPTTPPEHDLVAVMMPFATEFDAVYTAIKSACEVLQLRCQRADDVWKHSEVIQDVFSLIFRSSFVISDFTNKNVNVFYETGVAHTLGRPVVPISQNRSDVPFDLQHHRYIPYLHNAEGLRDLTTKLSDRLRTLMAE